LQEVILNAEERITKSGKFKEAGYIPGILYGDGIDNATSVKFNESDLRRILSKHGAHTKLWIQYNDDKKFGFIKDIQKHPVSHQILHMDIQIVSQEHDVKMQLPIIFSGENQLRQNQLHLQVQKSVVDVIGKVILMPDALYVDVSEKEHGYMITAKDIELNEEIRILNPDDIYGSIGHLKITTIEEPEKEEVESEEDADEAEGETEDEE